MTAMDNRGAHSLVWQVVAGLVVLQVLAGCASHKGAVGTASVGENTGGGAAAVPAAPKGPPEEMVQAPPAMAAKAAPESMAPKVRDLLNVYFAFDRWALTVEGKKALAENSGLLKQHPDARVLIEGYCDERGSTEYNLVLGEKRAAMTRQYLQSLGITNPIGVTSFGKERQVCAEHDESCYWKNRRAHLVVQEDQ